jgi:hypothetical protein
MNLASVAVGGDAGATDFHARPISLLKEEGDHVIRVNLRSSAFSSFSVLSVSLW